MMPRHGDLDQVVMNEYSALLLLSLLLVLMFLLFCCNYALEARLDPLDAPLELGSEKILVPSPT